MSDDAQYRLLRRDEIDCMLTHLRTVLAADPEPLTVRKIEGALDVVMLEHERESA